MLMFLSKLLEDCPRRQTGSMPKQFRFSEA
jgi:hypothetical protein